MAEETLGCEVVEGELVAFVQGELAAEEQRGVKVHLLACPACRERREAIQATLDAVAILPPVPVSEGFQRKLEVRLVEASRFLRQPPPGALAVLAAFLRHRVATSPILVFALVLHLLILSFLAWLLVRPPGGPGTGQMVGVPEGLPDDPEGAGGLEGRLPDPRLAPEPGGEESARAGVRRALAWLAARQREDGSWPAGPDGTAGQVLVLRAFRAGHSTAEAGMHRQTVSRGLAWLRRQGPEGMALLAAPAGPPPDLGQREAWLLRQEAAGSWPPESGGDGLADRVRATARAVLALAGR